MNRQELLAILDIRLTVAQEMRRSATARIDTDAYHQAFGRIREIEDIRDIVKSVSAEFFKIN